MASRFSVR